ncbi:response regulator [Siccirubricoccus sp. KC 17139]|uniref:Response regulator n=2 Tax=Siccirubricoccus soli TaxID=2899147 RepID=A0ABT1DAR7_9PROT|nr:response regulator [Siccirubricoccus soli]MCP2684409.1 response regulator [Siccirubricoccus soli]
MLEGDTHSVVLCADAPAALRHLERESFDLVISDVVMPGGMSGLELARTVRQRWPGLPVLLATGYLATLDVPNGEFSVLQKPFTAIELAGAIDLALREPHPQPA